MLFSEPDKPPTDACGKHIAGKVSKRKSLSRTMQVDFLEQVYTELTGSQANTFLDVG